MRIVQVIPNPDCDNFLSLLKQKQRDLRKIKRGTFLRVSANRWKHVSYSGYIDFSKVHKSISIIEVRSKATGANEWQLLHSFLGFLDRHFHEEIQSITILYRD